MSHQYEELTFKIELYKQETFVNLNRNPRKAGFAESVGAYRWSKHRGYLSIDAKWDRLHKNYFLPKLRVSTFKNVNNKIIFNGLNLSELLKSETLNLGDS